MTYPIDESRSAALLCADPGAVADSDLLAMLLDGDALAVAGLLTAFGSVAGVLAAPFADVARMAGEGPARTLAAVKAAAIRLAKAQASSKPLLNNYRKVIEYCRALQGRDEAESFRVLYLDKQNRLIGDEVLFRGTVDHTPVYPREVAKAALRHNATALIVVHNHPSGNPGPSDSDIKMTKRLKDALAPLGVIVLDHLIVTAEGDSSLQALGLI